MSESLLLYKDTQISHYQKLIPLRLAKNTKEKEKKKEKKGEEEGKTTTKKEELQRSAFLQEFYVLGINHTTFDE